MRSASSIAVIVTVALVGAAAGYLLEARGERGAESPAGRDASAVLLARMLAGDGAEDVEAGPALPPALPSLHDLLDAPTAFAREQVLYLLAESLDPTGLEARIAEAAALTVASARRDALEVLFRRFASLDAVGAQRHLLSLGLDLEPVLLQDIYRVWARDDLDAAIGAAARLSGAWVQLAGDAILGAYSDLDPETLQDLAQRLPPQHNPEPALIEAIGRQARIDPYEAAERAMVLDTVGLRRDAMWRVAEVWAGVDPAAAHAFGRTLEDPVLARAFQSAAVKRWTASNPDKVLETLEGLPASDERDGHLRYALRELSWRNVAQALTWAERLEVDGKAQWLVSNVLYSWAEIDIQAALQYADSHADRRERHRMLAVVGHQYGRQDPEGALAWADQLESSHERRQVMERILDGIVERNPQRALELLKTIPSPERDRIAGMTLSTLSRRDPRLVSDFVFQLDPIERERVIQTLADGWAQHDVAAALQWAEQLDDDSRRVALPGVLHAWIQREPEAAARYIVQKGGSHSESVLSHLASTLAELDPARALAWIEPYRGEPLHNRLLTSIASSWATRDPGAAASFAQGIGEEGERVAATRAVLQTWLLTEPRSVSAWIMVLQREEQQHLTDLAVEALGHSSTEDAEAFVRSLSSGPGRDRAAQALLSRVRVQEEALRWINSIESEKLRDQAAENWLWQAMRTGDADKFLQEAKITPRQRQNLEEEIVQSHLSD